MGIPMRSLAELLGLEEEQIAAGVGPGMTGGHSDEMPSLADVPLAESGRAHGPLMSRPLKDIDPAAAEEAQARMGEMVAESKRAAAPPPKQADGSWSPDWLAAVAAFTKNPALMQKLQAREAAKAKEPELEMARAKDARDAELQPYRKQAIQSQMSSRQAYGDKTAQDARIKGEAHDPQSRMSQSFIATASSALESKAQMLSGKFPDIARRMYDASKGLAGQSYEQAKATLAALGPVAKSALDEAQRAVSNSQRNTGLSLQAANLAESQRYHDIADENADLSREESSGSRIEARLAKDQEKLNEQIEGLGGTEELLSEVKTRKADVDTGWLMDKVHKARQFIGIPDKNYDTLEALLSTVDNEIIKLQAGGNVTAGEAARMRQQLAMMDQNDPTFDAKLDTMLQNVRMKKSRKVNQYQRNADGTTIDRSNTARQQTKRSPALTPGEQGMKAPSGAKPGQKVRQKSTGKVFIVQPDGSMVEAQ